MNFRILLCFLLLVFLYNSCVEEPRADVIFFNGDIVTMVTEDEVQQAIAIKDGKILYVGSQEDLESYQGGSTEMLSLIHI